MNTTDTAAIAAVKSAVTELANLTAAADAARPARRAAEMATNARRRAADAAIHAADAAAELAWAELRAHIDGYAQDDDHAERRAAWHAARAAADAAFDARQAIADPCGSCGTPEDDGICPFCHMIGRIDRAAETVRDLAEAAGMPWHYADMLATCWGPSEDQVAADHAEAIAEDRARWQADTGWDEAADERAADAAAGELERIEARAIKNEVLAADNAKFAAMEASEAAAAAHAVAGLTPERLAPRRAARAADAADNAARARRAAHRAARCVLAIANDLQRARNLAGSAGCETDLDTTWRAADAHAHAALKSANQADAHALNAAHDTHA